MQNRCDWVGEDKLYIKYHDEEWGVPVHDDVRLFEFLLLEGAQAGLSWITVLRKREEYKRAFDEFDPKKISNYSEEKIKSLLVNPGIIRNRLKINSAVINAKLFKDVQKEFGTFDSYIWRFVDYKTIKNKIKKLEDYPVKTKEAEEMSKDLLKRGFKFVGPTICYAFMQATGMVNDHKMSCFRYSEV